jgi:fatty-acyl-CoA synthase
MRLPLTPLDFYRRSGRLFARKIAVVDRGRRFTFAEFADRVERLAGALVAGGLKAREPVSVLSPNTHHALEAWYGVPAAGGVVHPVSPRRTALEIADLVNDAGSRVLLFHASLTGLVREILGTLKAVESLIVLEGDARGLDFPAREYETMLEDAWPHAPDVSLLDEDAPLALVHTSGGVEKPRGALLSHRALALHALYGAIAMGLREDDVCLCSVPFAHMTGGGNPQINVALAATSVLARRTDPVTLLGLIERERASVWITSPMVLQRLLRSPALDHSDRGSLRLVLVGGAPVSRALLLDAEENLGARCLEVYGVTEAVAFVGADHRPVLGVEVRVVDESGRAVRPDSEELGEILVRGNTIMTGYHRDAEATAQTLCGGWLHTGDLAEVDGGGGFRIRGRKKDVILVDGRRVSAREVEVVLDSHPEVAESCVIAAPDPEHGEVPVGLVVSRGSALTEGRLLDFARARLAPYQVPRGITFLPSLPRNEAGEVLKSELQTPFVHA